MRKKSKIKRSEKKRFDLGKHNTLTTFLSNFDKTRPKFLAYGVLVQDQVKQFILLKVHFLIRFSKG